MRRLLAVTIPLLVLAGVSPALADPVTTGRVAALSFGLQPEPGVRLDVDVYSVSSTGGDRVEVAVRRCIQNVCDSPQYYAGPLERGALAIDGSKAVGRLRTRIGGLDVAADWTPLPPGTVVLGGTHGGGTDGDLAVETYRADPAAVRLVLGVGHCTGAGEVGDEARLELPEGSSGATVPLRTLRLPPENPVCRA